MKPGHIAIAAVVLLAIIAWTSHHAGKAGGRAALEDVRLHVTLMCPAPQPPEDEFEDELDLDPGAASAGPASHSHEADI